MSHDEEERVSITTVDCDEEGFWSGQASWRSLAAELASTALLVLLTCAAAAEPAPPLQRALASGLVVALLVQCFGHVSGAQMNPAVTLAAVVRRRCGAAAGALEAAAQLAGAALGGLLLRALRPGAAAACCTAPRAGVSLLQAVGTEALLAACLALANCAAWDARNLGVRDSWPLRVGLSVAALSLVAGDVTGASMNPARSFAPALWSGVWTDHWVYWAGPLGGAALAAALYGAVWRAPPASAARAPGPCKGH